MELALMAVASFFVLRSVLMWKIDDNKKDKMYSRTQAPNKKLGANRRSKQLLKNQNKFFFLNKNTPTSVMDKERNATIQNPKALFSKLLGTFMP